MLDNYSSLLGLILEAQELERTHALAREAIKQLKEEIHDLTAQVASLQKQIWTSAAERTLLQELAKALRPYLDIPDDGLEDR